MEELLERLESLVISCPAGRTVPAPPQLPGAQDSKLKCARLPVNDLLAFFVGSAQPDCYKFDAATV